MKRNDTVARLISMSVVALFVQVMQIDAVAQTDNEDDFRLCLQAITNNEDVLVFVLSGTVAESLTNTLRDISTGRSSSSSAVQDLALAVSSVLWGETYESDLREWVRAEMSNERGLALFDLIYETLWLTWNSVPPGGSPIAKLRTNVDVIGLPDVRARFRTEFVEKRRELPLSMKGALTP